MNCALEVSGVTEEEIEQIRTLQRESNHTFALERCQALSTRLSYEGPLYALRLAFQSHEVGGMKKVLDYLENRSKERAA